MRIRDRYLVAAVLAVFSTATHAGFTISVSAAPNVLVNGTRFDRYDITAINTGGDTGTQIKGLEFAYTGSRAYFQVLDTDDDRIPDVPNLLSTQLTRIRVNNAASNNSFVGVTPSSEPDPFNRFMVGLKTFSLAIANTGTTQATGTGYQIARLFLLPGQGGSVSGNLGGEIGSKVPFSTYYGPVASSPPLPGGSLAPRVDAISAEPALATFGPNSSDGASFSVRVSASDPDAGDVLSLLFTQTIAGVYDLAVSGGGAGPQEFTITGKVDASRLYQPVIVPFMVRDQTGAGSVDSICVFAVPEPAGLGIVSGLLGTARRRR